MASERHTGFPGGLATRGVAAARGRARRARPRAALSGAGLRVVPLFIDGIPRLRVYVAVGGLVDIAVRELGARITEVEPLRESPMLAAAPAEEADEA